MDAATDAATDAAVEAAVEAAIEAYLSRWRETHGLVTTDTIVFHDRKRFGSNQPLGDVGDAIVNSPTGYTWYWTLVEAECFEHPDVGLVALYTQPPDPNKGLAAQVGFFAEVAKRFGAGFAASAVGHGPIPTIAAIHNREPCAMVSFVFVFPDQTLGASQEDANALARRLVAPFDPLLSEMPSPALRTNFRNDDTFPWARAKDVPAPDWMLRLRRAHQRAQIPGRRQELADTPKRCFACGESKPRREFYSSSHKSDGYMSRCKVCDNERNRAGTEDLKAARNTRSRINNDAGAELIRRHREEFTALKQTLRPEVEAEIEAEAEETGKRPKLSVRLRGRALAALRQAHKSEFDAIKEELIPDR